MKTEYPSDYWRDVFREELIESGGESTFSVYMLSEEVSRFRFYLEMLEQFIASEETTEIEMLKRKVGNLSEEQHDTFWAWYYPVHWDEVFRGRLRASFLISLVSFVEGQLKQVCKDTAVVVRSELSIYDWRGGVVEKSRKFLEEFGGFTKPSIEEWNFVIRINYVRNVLVHCNGCISRYRHKEQLSQLVNEHPGLSIIENSIELEKEFCVFCLNRIESFFRVLRDELKDLCERVKSSASK